MRIARGISTSFSRKRQALYEPYVPPLNEEQKKALRKIIAKDMPNYHGRINQDINRLLLAYDTLEATRHNRRRTVEHVEQIIQSAFGSKYSVIDRSVYNYARDFEYAPLELAVHDQTRPIGFPPGTEGEPLPDPYKHESLAELLQQHAYTGSFVAGDAMRTLPPLDPDATPGPRPTEDRGPLPITPPWPSYTPHPTRHLTYPPVLFAEHTSGATGPFFLSPPVPTHMPLIRLLRTYASINKGIPDLITLIILWTRSINLPELTPTCVALMVIGWLQHKRSLMSLQNPASSLQARELAQRDEGVWFRSRQLPKGQKDEVFWLETAFVSSPSLKPSSKLGPLLLDFFGFWSQKGDNSGFVSSSQYLSLREGAAKPRARSVAVNTDFRLQEDDRLIAQGQLAASLNEQPIMWQTQPIVIQDPFIPSFNHAQSMSKSACTYFHYLCSLSYRTIHRSHPVTTILGAHLPPPSGNVHRSLGYHRSYASTAFIGRDMTLEYEANLPSLPVFEARAKTILRVQQAIRKRFGNEYSVECFGSTRYGVSTATSDLDLVVIDRERLDGFSPKVNLTHLPDVYDIKLVARTLHKSGFAQVFAIPKASVPIVKFRDPATGLDCDLNVNDQLGLWNTQLISQYCNLVPDLVRPMIMAVKRWAKSHGMNDPSGQLGPITFSSYALVLMIIGFLQIKGALPNLQAGLEPLRTGATQGTFWVRTKKDDRMRCDTRFTSGDDWMPEVRLDLDEALAGWFMFWASEHKYDEQLLSIRKGGVLQRVKKKKKEKPRIDVTTHEERGQSPEEGEFVVAAFANENVNEESEDAANECQGGVDTAAEISNEDEGQLNHDTIEVRPDGIFSESRSPDVPPVAEVRISTEAAHDRPASSELQQPSEWNSHMLVVVDPFIRTKNVCANIGKANIQRFQAECRRSVQLLEWGVDLESLMGDGEPVQGPRPGRGRGGRGKSGGGRASRARGFSLRKPHAVAQQQVVAL